MQDWFQLSADDVLAQFNDSETAAYDAAKGDGQGADLEDIIASVSNQIRKAYLDGGRALDWTLPNTIPPGEKQRAIALVRWSYLLALPTGRGLQTDERKKASDQATDYLLLVARRKVSHAGAVGVARPGQRVQPFPTGTGGGGDWSH
jgi:hypothetical protein